MYYTGVKLLIKQPPKQQEQQQEQRQREQLKPNVWSHLTCKTLILI